MLIALGCRTYLNGGCYNWQHNSVLSIITQSLQSIKTAKLYVDLPGYLSLRTTIGKNLRPDLHLSTAENSFYIC